MLDLLSRFVGRRTNVIEDRYAADELRYKYGQDARTKALERAGDHRLLPRDRRHWRRVSDLLKP